MGIGFVLFVWAVAGTILACVSGLVLGGVTAFFTQGFQKSRRRAIVLASAFPFACLGWAGLIFIFQALVNGFVLHRDAGLGDTGECPLPNGYEITMIDVTDQGWVYNPKTQIDGGIGEREDAVAGVRTVQVAGRYIFGAADSHLSDFGKPTDVDLYFVLDTNTGKRTQFKQYDDLRRAASQLGFQLRLEDIETVYSKYRFTWFDVLVGVLVVLPPAAYFFILARWIVKLHKAGHAIPLPA